MRYLALYEVLELYQYVLGQTGGSEGIRDVAALESAIAQPRATFRIYIQVLRPRQPRWGTHS